MEQDAAPGETSSSFPSVVIGIKSEEAKIKKEEQDEPDATTVAVGESALQQLGLNIHRMKAWSEPGETRPFYSFQKPGIWGMNTTYLDFDSREYLSIECQKHLKEADRHGVIASTSKIKSDQAMKRAYKVAIEALDTPSYTYAEHKKRFQEDIKRLQQEERREEGAETVPVAAAATPNPPPATSASTQGTTNGSSSLASSSSSSSQRTINTVKSEGQQGSDKGKRKREEKEEECMPGKHSKQKTKK
ncbi:hypothetical protein V8F06_007191 [Rhypophila decipiens]